jgi:hypothetical protein
MGLFVTCSFSSDACGDSQLSDVNTRSYTPAVHSRASMCEVFAYNKYRNTVYPKMYCGLPQALQANADVAITASFHFLQSPYSLLCHSLLRPRLLAVPL